MTNGTVWTDWVVRENRVKIRNFFKWVRENNYTQFQAEKSLKYVKYPPMFWPIQGGKIALYPPDKDPAAGMPSKSVFYTIFLNCI